MTPARGFGQFDRVALFVLSRSASCAQGRRRADGARIVSHVEIRPELRCGEVPFAGHQPIANRDRPEDERDTKRKDRHVPNVMTQVGSFRLRVKLRRTAGAPNAAAALGWPAVALAEAVLTR